MSFLCFRIFSDFPFGLQAKFQILSQASTQVCVCPLASFSNTSPYAHLPFLRLHALGFFPCALPFPCNAHPLLSDLNSSSFPTQHKCHFLRETFPNGPTSQIYISHCTYFRESPQLYYNCLCTCLSLPSNPVLPLQGPTAHQSCSALTVSEMGVLKSKELRGFWTVWLAVGRSLRRPKGINL